MNCPVHHFGKLLLAVGIGHFLIASTPTLAQSGAATTVRWNKLEDGLETATYTVPLHESFIKPEITLLRIDPKLHALRVVTAQSELGAPLSDVKTMTQHSRGVAGINANFFDHASRPLGLVVSDRVQQQKPHNGGAVLTGVFYTTITRGGLEHPKIVSRDELPQRGVVQAFQAGPRLIVGGRAVPLKKPDSGTRRSGVAITRTDEVLLFATVLRFPGATLKQVQEMLLLPELGVVDALNLDGGGSSQLYIGKTARNADDTFGGDVFVTGGDLVPVGLVVRRREETVAHGRANSRKAKYTRGAYSR